MNTNLKVNGEPVVIIGVRLNESSLLAVPVPSDYMVLYNDDTDQWVEAKNVEIQERSVHFETGLDEC
jgi:hypothetical protein